jgi:hypothetical protein
MRLASRIIRAIGGSSTLETFRREISVLFGCLVFAGLIWAARSFERRANDPEQARAEEARAWQERKRSLQVIAEDLKDREQREKERERREKQLAKIERLEFQPPKIANKPPFPKLEVDANPFDFGTVTVNEPGSHKFKIKNIGQSPLVIYRPLYGSSRPAAPPRKEIPPGASAEIELNFTPREATSCFAKTTALWTNDPAHPKLELKLFGIVRDPKQPQRNADRAKAEFESQESLLPKIADEPPFPKIEVDANPYDVGARRVGEMARHAFNVKNVGHAPLVIDPVIDWHCGSQRRQVIAPGASAEIEVRFTPRESTPSFVKSFLLSTNDPQRSEIQLTLVGGQPVNVEPERTWDAGRVTEDRDGIATGIVSSTLDSEFKITSVDLPDKNVKVQYRPLFTQERRRDSGKVGYFFTVTVGRGVPMGHFRREMQIHTTLAGNTTISVDVTAVRTGPILFLTPSGTSRAYWQAEKSLINLGRFRHEAGSKVVLPALVDGSKATFAITRVDTDADLVSVKVLPNPEISQGEWQGVRFVFEVRPGKPPVTRVAQHSVHLNLKTNHPKLRELSFQVEFVSE